MILLHVVTGSYRYLIKKTVIIFARVFDLFLMLHLTHIFPVLAYDILKKNII